MWYVGDVLQIANINVLTQLYYNYTLYNDIMSLDVIFFIYRRLYALIF